MSHTTLRVREHDDVWTVALHRPEARNAIDAVLVRELTAAIAAAGDRAKIVVLEGLPDVFCTGADFQAIARGTRDPDDPARLYDLWTQLATGPFVSIAHVRGRANAGGVGFVAACDVVLADPTAQLGLSELLFGLLPACVLPFLIRRIGVARASYLTLMTQPISADQALGFGLIDAVAADSNDLVRRHLLRLRRLERPAVARHKQYLAQLDPQLARARDHAIATNRAVFADPDNLQAIARFVDGGAAPWSAR